MPASTPCARRLPNSSTSRPLAAQTMRAALLAMVVWNVVMASSAVSTSCASMIGAETRRIGS